MLKIKATELKTPEALKLLVERIKLEETMSGDMMCLDPQPSYCALVEALENLPPSPEGFFVARRLKRAVQYDTRSKVRHYVSGCAEVITDPKDLEWMLNKFGYDILQRAPIALIRDWADTTTGDIYREQVRHVARNPQSTLDDGLRLWSRMVDGYGGYDNDYDVLGDLKDKCSGPDDEQRLADLMSAKVYARLNGTKVDLNMLERFPRRVVDNKLVIELPRVGLTPLSFYTKESTS